MVIKSVTARGIGPFYEQFTLQLEDRVTILVGANDMGKTSLLRALELSVSESNADDAFINQDHIQETAKPWPKDESIYVEAFVNLTDAVDMQGAHYRISKGDNIRVRRLLARDVAKVSSFPHLAQHGHQQGANLKLPAVIKPGLDGNGTISDEIDLKNPSSLERALLDAAFKSRFDYARFVEMKPIPFTRAIRSAEDELNRLLGRVLPQPGMVLFDLRSVEGDRTKLAILVRDRHDGITPFGSRGAGLRRIVTLVAELLTIHQGAHHRLIILDEPENSLHADAQHLLREFLYGLTSDGRTQVVYATHSPGMVNPMRSEQIRVLVRDKSGATGTTKILPRPDDKNFLGLRTSLGMSAADSLLFAPVTVIAEGATEFACLPRFIEKLELNNELEVSDVKKLLGLSNFMDGMGDSYEFLCRLAKTHGVRPVLFLDGDKREKVASVREIHPEVPIVFLPGTSEFEELVPATVYLKALSELTSVEHEGMESSLAGWIAAVPFRSRKAFSKRVEGWFTDNHDIAFPAKKILMVRAIELAEAGQLNAEPVRELLAAIRSRLNETSFS